MFDDILDLPLNMFGDFLEHHGIKGQKWGVRNAEWYPIDAYMNHLRLQDVADAAKKVGKGTVKVAKKTGEVYSSSRKKHKERNAVKKAENFEKKKQRILSSGTPAEILSIADQLSNDELNYARTRNALLNDLRAAEDRRVKQIKDAEFRKKWGKVLDVAQNVRTFSEPIDSVATAVERFNKLSKALSAPSDAQKEKEKKAQDEKIKKWLDTASDDDILKVVKDLTPEQIQYANKRQSTTEQLVKRSEAAKREKRNSFLNSLSPKDVGKMKDSMSDEDLSYWVKQNKARNDDIKYIDELLSPPKPAQTKPAKSTPAPAPTPKSTPNRDYRSSKLPYFPTSIGSSKRHFKNSPEVREAMRISKAEGWDALTTRQKELLLDLL